MTGLEAMAVSAVSGVFGFLFGIVLTNAVWQLYLSGRFKK